MTYRMILAAALLLALGVSASADMRTIAEAYEVRLSNFRAPGSENGAASFRACDTCAQQIAAVTPATRYLVNGKAVTLSNFRKALLSVTNRDKKHLLVKQHLESETITKIAVSL